MTKSFTTVENICIKTPFLTKSEISLSSVPCLLLFTIEAEDFLNSVKLLPFPLPSQLYPTTPYASEHIYISVWNGEMVA